MEKFIKILFSATLLLVMSQPSSAHEPEESKKTESQETVSDSTVHTQDPATETMAGEHLSEHHEMGTSIVKARFSDFPTLHPLLVHFPIVLLLLAFLTQLLGLFAWKKQFSLFTVALLLGGFLGAYLVGNFFHPHTEGLSDAARQVLDLHEFYADYTLWTSGIALLLKITSHFFLKRKIWMELMVVAVIGASVWSVSHAAHYGATLVHLHGVGPQGNHLEMVEHKH